MLTQLHVKAVVIKYGTQTHAVWYTVKEKHAWNFIQNKVFYLFKFQTQRRHTDADTHIHKHNYNLNEHNITYHIVLILQKWEQYKLGLLS